MKLCPRCSKINYYDENKCVHCGEDISAIEPKENLENEIKELKMKKNDHDSKEYNKLRTKQDYLLRIGNASSMFDLYRLIYLIILSIILLVGSIILSVNFWMFLLYLLISLVVLFINIMILTIISGVLWSIHNHIELKYHIAKNLSNLENQKT